MRTTKEVKKFIEKLKDESLKFREKNKNIAYQLIANVMMNTCTEILDFINSDGDESLSIIANTLTDILNTAEEVIHSEDS